MAKSSFIAVDYIDEAIFDHDISPERTAKLVDEFVAGSKLSTKEYNSKYGV